MRQCLWGIRVLGLVAGLCAVLRPAQASAQAAPRAELSADTAGEGKDKAARDMFNAGRTAFNEGLFEDALAAFQRAYQLSKRPQLLFNIGMAADSARQDEVALRAFEQYLRDVPVADNREYVEGRIVILKKEVDSEAAPVVAPAAVAAAQPQPTAAAAPVAATQPAAKDEGDGNDSGLLSKWWFWTAVGAGVAAITVTSVVLANQEPDKQSGDVGGVIQTVRSAR